MSETKTVRVRIAVAVTPGGMWSAAGRSRLNDDGAFAIARELGQSAYRPSAVFVEADIPLPPEPATIPGRIVPTSGGEDGR